MQSMPRAATGHPIADHASECNDAWIEDYALIGD
jgi:hypothetical protein